MKETPTLRQLGALLSHQVSPGDIPKEAWPELIGASLQQGLAPMLLWVVKQSAPEIISEPLWTPVITATRSTGLRYMLLETTRKQVCAALEAALIPSLWLKGIGLARTVYPQPVLRPMGDLDVLVPYEQRESALRVIEGLGYHFYDTDDQLISSQKALELGLTHHYCLRGGANDSVVLELHFRLLSTDNELLSPDNLVWFWTQTIAIQNGSQFAVPAPEAHLLYLCAHAILQHGEWNTSLRQYFDLHQLITNAPIDWDKVTEQAGKLGWGYAVERALSIAVQYFSTPIPEAVLVELRKSGLKDAAVVARVTRTRAKGARWELMVMQLHQLTFAEKASLVRRILFPPRSYMRIRYHLRPDQSVWLFYLYRWFDQGREIGWAMWNSLKRSRRRGK